MEYVAAVALLGGLYLIVFALLRGGVSVARSGKGRVVPRLIVCSEGLEALDASLTSRGWHLVGERSAHGDSTYRRGPLTITASSSAEGSTLAFVGLTCSKHHVAELDRQLDALVEMNR